MQQNAVEKFWTEIFPRWGEWVLEYRAARVISSITAACVDASVRVALVPDTTSQLHVPAGKGPHFLAEAQTQILGVLPDTLAGGGGSLRGDLLVQHASARGGQCVREGSRRWSVECRRCCKWRRDVKKRTRVQVRARCLTNPLHV
jgi:hypothetical protein